jgi:tetratricopeptide (TPR) repeat protein
VVRGRDALLEEFREPLALRSRTRRPADRRPLQGGRVWVIAGMGGLGKSTVALAAAKLAQSNGWRVWWVTATDTASLTGGMLEVLQELEAPETVLRPVREGTPTAAGRAWDYLNGPHPAGREWLLIFDNADDPAVLAGPGAACPADYTGWLRPGSPGSVIVTTRHMDARTWGREVLVRHLPPLDEDASAQVLADLSPLAGDAGGGQARALGCRLGGLPLALYLAGSYLASPFARWHTFADYHRALDGTDLPAALYDLDNPVAGERADIQRTWELSLNALDADDRPQARTLLFMLSCYAPATPIPVGVLRPELLADVLGTGADSPGEAGDGIKTSRRIRWGMRGLADAGFIGITTTGPGGEEAVTVHQVIADVNRVRMLTMDPGALRTASAAAVRLLDAVCGELDHELPSHWPGWKGLAPHVLALLHWAGDRLDDDTLAGLLLVASRTSDMLVLSGAAGTAEQLATAGADAGKRLADSDPAFLAVRRSLAEAVVEQGCNADAEQLYRDVLADHERALDHDHPTTLMARYGHVRALGFHLRPRAEEMHRAVLADQERVLGRDDPATLMTQHWLGRLLIRLGRPAEAAATYQEVLDGRRRVLGEDHPDTLVTRHTLAWAIAQQGRYAQAEREFWEVLKDQQRVLGQAHHHVLGTGRAIGWCMLKQGRHAAAERHLRQVFGLQRQARGDDHPATLQTLQTLASAIARQGRASEAEELFRQALKSWLEHFGPDHRHALVTQHMLAQAIADQGRHAEARSLLREVLARRERELGADHPDTRQTLADIERLGTGPRLG